MICVCVCFLQTTDLLTRDWVQVYSNPSDSSLVAAEEVTRDTPRVYQDPRHTLTYPINKRLTCVVFVEVEVTPSARPLRP